VQFPVDATSATGSIGHAHCRQRLRSTHAGQRTVQA
jgi:hypothetical protein